MENGYRVCYPINYTRTTLTQLDKYFANLAEGLELNGINQLVQTDITYYRVAGCFYYIVFIIDVYSRFIVGYSANRTLTAEGNIKALKRMLCLRKGSCENLIHHSDRGSQYIDKLYLQLLIDNGIKASMCKHAWENPYAERINRTIKEEYLDHWQIDNYRSFVSCVRKAVNHYNGKRRHAALGDLTPRQFEDYVEKIPEEQRSKYKLYKPL